MIETWLILTAVIVGLLVAATLYGRRVCKKQDEIDYAVQVEFWRKQTEAQVAELDAGLSDFLAALELPALNEQRRLEAAQLLRAALVRRYGFGRKVSIDPRGSA